MLEIAKIGVINLSSIEGHRNIAAAVAGRNCEIEQNDKSISYI